MSEIVRGLEMLVDASPGLSNASRRALLNEALADPVACHIAGRLSSPRTIPARDVADLAELAITRGRMHVPAGATVVFSGPMRAAAEAWEAQKDAAPGRCFAPAAAPPVLIHATPAGAALEWLGLFDRLEYAHAYSFWHRLGVRYGAKAAGDVVCFVHDALPEKTFRSHELPRLLVNPRVRSFLVADEETCLNAGRTGWHFTRAGKDQLAHLATRQPLRVQRRPAFHP